MTRALLLVLALGMASGCGEETEGESGAADTGADAHADVATQDAGADVIEAIPDAAADMPSDSPADAPDVADLRVDAADSGPSGWIPVANNVTDQLLCDLPADYVSGGGDPYFIDARCGFEADDSLSDRDPNDVPASLRVVTWNLHFGTDSAEVATALRTHPELSGAAILLLNEVSRYDGQSDPPNINQVRELATMLAMNYVYGVEWDRRLDPAKAGEHGLAILSKYPLGNATMIRHAPQNDWWAEDMRYGGRATLAATAKIGDRHLRLYSTHLDTRGFASGRAEQGAELRADADLPEHPSAQLVGGDFNTFLCNPIVLDCTGPPAAERVVQDFLAAGWLDGTAGFNGFTFEESIVVLQRLDWIFYRGLTVTPGVALSDAPGSDHRPLYTDVAWEDF